MLIVVVLSGVARPEDEFSLVCREIGKLLRFVYFLVQLACPLYA